MRLVVALFALTLVAGCKKPAPPAPAAPQIVEVRVDDKTPSPARPPLDTALFTARAADAVAKASGLRVVDGGTGAGRRYRLVVDVRTEQGEHDGQSLLRALVDARLEPIGEGPEALSFTDTAVAEKAMSAEDKANPKKAWDAHVARAVEDLVRGVGARAHLATAQPAELVAALDGKDDDLRDEAARLCGERRERACVPSLLKHLKSEDGEVRDRAIGALSAIGDRRAVKPLTEVARFRDLADLPKVLDALSAIGGDEARAYLEFVASGHDSPEIRELAKQALDHLLERAQRDAGAKT